VEAPTIARAHASAEEQQRYHHVVAEHSSPLRREIPGYDVRLQAGKEHNIAVGWVYKLFFGHRLGYHNRLLPTDVVRLFEEAGFELITLRRMILPDRRYVEGADVLVGQPGIPRGLLTGRYRMASPEDLRTAAAHYLFLKRS
jgi:hypothetical protein